MTTEKINMYKGFTPHRIPETEYSLEYPSILANTHFLSFEKP